MKDEGTGRLDGSVQARYLHVTAEMRRRLLDWLTGLWNGALDQRLRCSVSSPAAAVLDALLWERC